MSLRWVRRLSKHFNADATRADQVQLDKHYYRKHGANAYYGQKDK